MYRPPNTNAHKFTTDTKILLSEFLATGKLQYGRFLTALSLFVPFLAAMPVVPSRLFVVLIVGGFGRLRRGRMRRKAVLFDRLERTFVHR